MTMTLGLVDTDLCVCGHRRRAHEHLRRGTDCCLCDHDCPRFRTSAGPRHVVSRMRTVLHRRG